MTYPRLVDVTRIEINCEEPQERPQDCYFLRMWISVPPRSKCTESMSWLIR
jgi:hypothetical protein